MRKWLLLFMLLAVPAWGQGVRYDNVAMTPKNAQGLGYIPNATITVCTSAGTGTPCTPLATIYTSATLNTTAPNPLTADQFGNFGFWAAPGTYVVTITALGYTSFTLTATLPPTASSTALKPATSDAVQFVSSNGLNTNDGFSWGTAKLTIPAAWAVLPATGGDIYVSAGVTSWAGGTIPANVRVHFAVAAISLTGPVTLGSGDMIDCVYGRSLDATPYRAGTVFTTSGLTSSQDAFLVPAANGVTIRGCTILMAGTGRNGIYLQGSSDSNLLFNTISDPGQDGILIDNTTQQSYDDVLVGNIVSHPVRDCYGFRTDAGTKDIDRIQLTKNSCGGRDPGGTTSLGANAFHFLVPSGATTTQTIADVEMSNDFGHLSNPGGTSNEIFLDYEGTDTTHAFINGVHITGEYEPDEGAAACTALSIKTAAAVNLEGVTFDGVIACATDTNIASSSTTNATNWYFKEQSSSQVTRTDVLKAVNTLSSSVACNGGFAWATGNGTPALVATSDGIIRLFRCDNSTVQATFWNPNNATGGNFVVDNVTQTLTNKTLIAPVIGSITNTGTLTLPTTTATLSETIASGTATMTIAAIAAGACGTTVTVAATGAATTDAISWSFNAAPAANPGELIVSNWPTSGNVNFQYCNPTAASVTPNAATLNWRVVR